MRGAELTAGSRRPALPANRRTRAHGRVVGPEPQEKGRIHGVFGWRMPKHGVLPLCMAVYGFARTGCRSCSMLRAQLNSERMAGWA